jgi:hypothetical protein
MANVNYSNPQEPDEELVLAPNPSNYSEVAGLSADSEMLLFTGLAAFTKFATLAVAEGMSNFDRVLVHSQVQLESDVNADDFSMLGVLFPDQMQIVGVANVGSDSTNKVCYFNHTGNAGNLLSNLDSVAEYSTTEGLLKFQLEILRGLDSKSLRTNRLNIRLSWDGTTKHKDIALVFGRSMLYLPPVLVVGCRGAASKVWIRRATIVADNLMSGRGPLEAI